jgi:hypothetical protein
MAAHAKLGPSAADRWMVCSASVQLVQTLSEKGVVDPSESSVFADEGTAAHEVRQLSLSLGCDPHDFIGTTIFVNKVGYPVTHEMADFLQPGIDWLREQSGLFDVEIRIDLSPWMPEQFGTLDAGCIVGTTLVLSDLKYGMGEAVEVERNRQQMLYALGYWHFKGRPRVDRILICIDQPRLGGLKIWECSFDDLMVFAAEVEAAYARIQSGQTEFVPGKKACRWCHAKKPVPERGYMGCAAYNAEQQDLFDGAFDDLSTDPAFTPPGSIDPERRAYIVQHASEARKWLAEMHDASLEAALAGNPDPGLKAVIGQKGDRKFTDVEKATTLLVGALGDEAFKPRAIIGIPDAERALKPGKKKPGNPEVWEALLQLVGQSDGKPILVPADDQREAIRPYADMFDDLD